MTGNTGGSTPDSGPPICAVMGGLTGWFRGIGGADRPWRDGGRRPLRAGHSAFQITPRSDLGRERPLFYVVVPMATRGCPDTLGQVPTTTRSAQCCRPSLNTRPASSIGRDTCSPHSPRLARTWQGSVNNKPLVSDRHRLRQLGDPSVPGLCGTDGSTERRSAVAWQRSRADSEHRTSGELVTAIKGTDMPLVMGVHHIEGG